MMDVDAPSHASASKKEGLHDSERDESSVAAHSLSAGEHKFLTCNVHPVSACAGSPGN